MDLIIVPLKKKYRRERISVILSELYDVLEFFVLKEKQTLVRFVACKFKYVGIVDIY